MNKLNIKIKNVSQKIDTATPHAINKDFFNCLTATKCTTIFN